VHETLNDHVDTVVRSAVKALGRARQVKSDTSSMAYWLERLGAERMKRAFVAAEDVEAHSASAFKYLMLGEIIADNEEEARRVAFPLRQVQALEILYIRAMNTAAVDMDMRSCHSDWKSVFLGKENFFRLATTGENLMHAVNDEDYNGRLNLDPLETSVMYGVQYLFAKYPPYTDMYESLAWGVDALQHQILDYCG
jgi:hypothetical protein